jgi:hypothetical protein
MGSVKLHAIDAEPATSDTVRTLEAVLEQARAGELSSVAVAYVFRDGSSGSEWSEAPSFSCLVGAITRMQFAIMEHAG